MKKKVLAFICALTILSSGIPAFAADGIKVFVNNYEVVFQGQAPVVLNGRTLVPLRGVMEAMGVEVVWDAKEKSVLLKRETQEAKFWVGKKTFQGGRTLMEEPVQMINGAVMMPLREVVGYFGGDISWDGVNKTASIHIREKEEGYATITYNKDLTDAQGNVLIQGTAIYAQLNEAVFGRNTKMINENISAWAKKGLEAYFVENKDSLMNKAMEQGADFKEWEYIVSYRDLYYDDTILSYGASKHGRHGIEKAEEESVVGFTYDLKTGERKTVTDFVTLPNNTTEREFLKSVLREHIQKNPGIYLKDAEKILEENKELPIEFYMAGPKKMIVFVGQEGLLSPVAAGILKIEKNLP